MIFLAQEGCGVLQTTGRCRFSPGFRSLGPGRCPGSCPRESLSLVVAHGNPKAKTRAPTSWCSSAVAAGTSLDPKGARDGHGGPKGDGWWWNDAGISEAAVLMYRCQDIVNHLPPPKKKTHTNHHCSDSPLEGTISTRALLIWSSNERCNWSTAQWPVPWFLWFSVEHPIEWGCALRM